MKNIQLKVVKPRAALELRVAHVPPGQLASPEGLPEVPDWAGARATWGIPAAVLGPGQASEELEGDRPGDSYPTMETGRWRHRSQVCGVPSPGGLVSF